MAIKGERGEPWRNSRKFGIETASTGRKRERRERREFSNRRRTKIICGIRFPRGNRVSIGSCEIPGVLTRAIYHARSVFAYVVKGLCVAYYALGHIGVVECLFKFACLRILHARTPSLSLSLSLIPPRLSPYLFISASALMSSHPRREKSPSSLLLLLLVRTNFPSVPLNFVPRLSWLAIEVFCDSRLFEEITPCLPSFPPCDVRIVKGDRIVVRCAVFESRNESMFFGGGGFVRCSWQTMRDI